MLEQFFLLYVTSFYFKKLFKNKYCSQYRLNKRAKSIFLIFFKKVLWLYLKNYKEKSRSSKIIVKRNFKKTNIKLILWIVILKKILCYLTREKNNKSKMWIKLIFRIFWIKKYLKNFLKKKILWIINKLN